MSRYKQSDLKGTKYQDQSEVRQSLLGRKAKDQHLNMSSDKGDGDKHDNGSQILNTNHLYTDGPVLTPEEHIMRLREQNFSKTSVSPETQKKKMNTSTSDVKLSNNKTKKCSPQKCHKNPDLNKGDERGRTLLHQAAVEGKILEIEALIQKGADMDLRDDKGMTALHLAVAEGQMSSVECLLSKGADPNITNLRGVAPIHTCVEQDRDDILKELLRHGVDANSTDSMGATPLHWTAYTDKDKCAVVLLANGVRLCQKCNHGYYPVHLAAQCGSKKVLELILTEADKCGYRREDVLRFTDSSNNMPLHTAVQRGDLESVRTVLTAGAAIDSAQADLQTAFHLASAQGSLDMLKLMLETQPEKKSLVLTQKDLTEMTPLHKAAIFDRIPVAEFLLDQGADLHSRDCNDRTPLLLAAEKRSWDTVKMLMSRGADLRVRDKHERNILHVIIINNGKPTDFQQAICSCNRTVQELLNEADEYGYTPLHYASKGGMVSTISRLLELGASLTAKTKCRESPIHFAAQYGRIQTCKRLLDTVRGPTTINESNEAGYTPLHLASSNGHTKVVDFLLHRGASLNRDNDGNTCLHVAAKGGYTDTMSIILSCHIHLLDVTNKAGDTALHIAAQEGHSRVVTKLLTMGAKLLKNSDSSSFLDLAIRAENRDVCAAVISHDRWREVLSMCSCKYGCPVLGLIKHIPEVCTMVLDRLRYPSDDDPKSPDYCYTYDFSLLQLSLEKVRKLREAGQDYEPLHALNRMVKYGRVDCLTHPLCAEYLRMKWKAYGFWFYMFNIVIYLTFLISLTTFVTTFPATHHDDYIHVNTTIHTDGKFHMLKSWHKILVIIIMAFCFLNILKELLQMVQQRMKYLRDANNLLEWILYITSAIFISPFVMGVSRHFQWQCGAIAVFLAWFNLLLYLQRVDYFGIYVVMFLEILKTLLQVIVVFFVLIVAFGLSFYIIMAGEGTIAFKSPALSLVTTGVMMLGNIDYLDSWVIPFSDGDNSTLHFSTLSFVILIVFILLMPILLMNLLIGLAVGDIEAVQRDATLKRLAMQVELHTEIERKLPQRVLEYVDKACVKQYPNRHKCLPTKLWGYFTRSESMTSPYETEEHSMSSHDLLWEEMHKQKNRLKQISANMEKHYDLLRLIVQKMEIQSEADDADEEYTTRSVKVKPRRESSIGWSSPAIRRTLLKQSSVLKKFGQPK